MDNTKEITVLSLCTGYGGLEIGLSRALEAVLRVVVVEVEAFALANLVAKAEEGAGHINAHVRTSFEKESDDLVLKSGDRLAQQGQFSR